MTAQASTVDTVEAIGTRWGTTPTSRMQDTDRGIAASILTALPGELTAPATDNHIVSCVLAGQSAYTHFHEGKQIFAGQVQTGSLNIEPAGLQPRGILAQPLSTLHLYLPTNYLTRRAEHLRRGRGAHLAVLSPAFASDPQLTALLCCLAEAIAHPTLLDRLYRDSLVDAIALRILQRWSNLSTLDELPRRGGLAPWQLKRAREAMLAQLGGDSGLAELADIVGCSPTHFSRAFKQSTGVAPFRWLAERRIEKAKELLQLSNFSLAEIALSIGFSDQSQFTTAFGRAVGTTPGAWRRERLT